MAHDLRVLIIGGGGRESAIYDGVKSSRRCAYAMVAPGNGGIDAKHRRPIDASDHAQVHDLVLRNHIDFVIIGPEAPLVAGLSDYLIRRDVRTFGCSRAASILEASKAATHDMCCTFSIPAPEGCVARSFGEAERLIRAHGYLVVKADGLCAGKGVYVCDDIGEAIEAARKILIDRIHGDAGSAIVLQKRHYGPEASFMYLCDGENAVLLGVARDHKRLHDGDRGLNTGGMGAYSPVPDVTLATESLVTDTMALPAIRYLAGRGIPYHGVLYVSIMITESGPLLIEYNVRFGDPETQVILPRVEEDLLTYLLACTVRGGLSILPPIELAERAYVCTVVASAGYPGPCTTGHPLDGIEEDKLGSYFLHAGTEVQGGRLVTAGGRVGCCIGYGNTIPEAASRSRMLARRVRFEGKHHRDDIAVGA